MNVLWMTNTPAGAELEFGYNHQGGSWISALLKKMTRDPKINLGICFFYDGKDYKTASINGIPYFGMPLKERHTLSRIYDRHRGILTDDSDKFIQRVLDEFSPDIIQVFGTEMGYGQILEKRSKKVLFHLQGLTEPYAEVYFPPRIGRWNTFIREPLPSIIRGLTFVHQHSWLKFRGKRELRLIRNWNYFTGRTDWDKNYTRLLNPEAKYFHCEEMLRTTFYSCRWESPAVAAKDKLIISSTINPNMYKGLDLIYRVIPLLDKIDFEWRIYGIEEQNSLNRIIKKVLGIREEKKKLHFMGKTSETELAKALTESHLFIHPSYIDNSPNSVCEAMLLGMPVLSSSVGGVSSLITHKTTGYLFNPYDRYDLAGWITHILQHYDDAVACGSEARRIALKRHDPESIHENLKRIYLEIISDVRG